MKVLIYLFFYCSLFHTTFGLARNLVLVDIDDTVVNTNSRSLQIFQEAGSELGISALRALEVGQVGYGAKETLGALGIENEKLISTLSRDWGDKFFSSAYIKYDHLIPGSLQFFSKVFAETNIKLVYFTGRLKATMEEGTLNQLKYFGFPGYRGLKSDEGRTQLVMREALSAKDAEYKKQVIEEFIKSGDSIIAYFDDSWTNLKATKSLFTEGTLLVRPNSDVNDPLKVPDVIQVTTYYYNRKLVDGKAQIVENSDQINGFIKQIAKQSSL